MIILQEREKKVPKSTSTAPWNRKKNCTISSYTMYEERCTMLGCVNMKKEEWWTNLKNSKRCKRKRDTLNRTRREERWKKEDQWRWVKLCFFLSFVLFQSTEMWRTSQPRRLSQNLWIKTINDNLAINNSESTKLSRIKLNPRTALRYKKILIVWHKSIGNDSPWNMGPQLG